MEFKNLAEVTQLEEVPEGASVLAATAEGEVVRVPGDGLGGGGGSAEFIVISDNWYPAFIEAMSGGSPQIPTETKFTCTSGHTYEDVAAIIMSGKPVLAALQVMYGSSMDGTPMNSNSCLVWFTRDSGEINFSFSMPNHDGNAPEYFALVWDYDGSIVIGG